MTYLAQRAITSYKQEAMEKVRKEEDTMREAVRSAKEYLFKTIGAIEPVVIHVDFAPDGFGPQKLVRAINFRTGGLEFHVTVDYCAQATAVALATSNGNGDYNYRWFRDLCELGALLLRDEETK